MGNAYKILAGISEENGPLGYLVVHGRMILK
jgi:hypothetical protein